MEEVEEKIRGKASLARLEAALNAHYAEQSEKNVYQYRWALRHPVVKEAITRAMGNRFPSRWNGRYADQGAVIQSRKTGWRRRFR